MWYYDLGFHLMKSVRNLSEIHCKWAWRCVGVELTWLAWDRFGEGFEFNVWGGALKVSKVVIKGVSMLSKKEDKYTCLWHQ